jgi:hypothetical protein
MKMRQEGDFTVFESDSGRVLAQYPIGTTPLPETLLRLQMQERLEYSTEAPLDFKVTGVTPFGYEQATTLGDDSAERKEVPLFRGVMRYFPAALAEVARVSKLGNDKHRPGKPMGHSRGVSSDHADCIMRHLMDLSENDGRDENGVAQVAYIAWRALALAQEWLEEQCGYPAAPAAEFPDDSE